MKRGSIQKLKKELLFLKNEKKKIYIERFYSKNQVKNNVIFFDDYTLQAKENDYYRIVKNYINEKKIHLNLYERKMINMHANEYNKNICEQIKLEKKMSQIYNKLLKKVDKIRFNQDLQYRIDYFKKNVDFLQYIMDRIIVLRNNIAKELGYSNFSLYCDDKFKRIDFCRSKLIKVENIISASVSPEIEKIQMNLSKDEDIQGKFKSYNDIMNLSEKELYVKLKQVENIYINFLSKLPDDIGKFARMLISENRLYFIDEENGLGVSGCLGLEEKQYVFYRANNGKIYLPIIFHEFGHAYQLWKNKNNVKSYLLDYEPREEIREIYSIFMEHLCMMKLEEDGWISHSCIQAYLLQSINYISYAFALDDFQRNLYENDVINGKKRGLLWKKISIKYNLYDTNEMDNFILSNSWLMDNEVYANPFGLTNYALAQVISLYFYYISLKEKKDVWKFIKKLCTIKHSETLENIFFKLDIKNPFNYDSMREMFRFYKRLINIKEVKLPVAVNENIFNKSMLEIKNYIFGGKKICQ